MSENKDNVVEFPNNDPKVRDIIEQANAGQTPEEIQQGNKLVLQMLEKNRRTGLDRLERTIQEFDNKTGSTPEAVTEGRLRNLEAGFRGAGTIIEALNTMFEMVKSDLIQTVQGVEQHTQVAFLHGAHHQVLLQVLIDKGIVTEDELKTTWDNIMNQKTEEVKQELKDSDSE